MKAPKMKKVTVDIPLPAIAKLNALAKGETRTFSAMTRLVIDKGLEVYPSSKQEQLL